MKILVDSDILIDFLSNQEHAVDFFSESVTNREIYISVISWTEVMYGFQKLKNSKDKLFQDFIDYYVIQILPIDQKVAEAYLKIKVDLESRRMALADFELLIGATAISHNLTLVTRNIRHFKKIKGMNLLPVFHKNI